MSDGDKKPCIRDIRSLREKLGMLQKGGAAPGDRATESGYNPFSQTDRASDEQNPRADLVENPDAFAGTDTAVSRISDPSMNDMGDVTEADDTGSLADIRPAAPSA